MSSPFWKSSAELAKPLGAARRLLVTLDFDGTLAALAGTPGEAALRPEFRLALRALAASPRTSVFILSGRALAGLRAAVGIRGLYYGGNHGMELSGPGFSWRDKAAARCRASVAGLAAALRRRFPAGTGVLVEDKGFSASVHYRKIKVPYRAAFTKHLRDLAAKPPAGLRCGRGHRVYEFRPVKAPHKGDAVLKIGRRLRADFFFAAGDDITDEDMFGALAGRGVTLRVGCGRATKASYCLKEQEEMLRVLRFLARLRRGL